MADTKISALSELTSLATDDEFVVVDKSDTTMAASGTDKRIKLGAPSLLQSLGIPVQRFATGRYYSAPGSINTVALLDGYIYCALIVVGEQKTFDRIAIEVTSAGAASTVIRLGIYNIDGTQLPSTLLLDAGTVAGDSTGVKEITISQALAPGMYALASVAQGGAPTVRGINGGSVGAVAVSNFGSGSASQPWRSSGLRGSSGHTGALPSPWPSTYDALDASRVFLRAA